MSDYIDREQAIDAVKTYWMKVVDDIPKGTGFEEVTQSCDMALEHNANILKAIGQLPSAQPEILACGSGELDAQPERRTGKWFDDGWHGDWAWETDGHGNCWHLYKCSLCDEKVKAMSNFCPNCGADMRGEQNETD